MLKGRLIHPGILAALGEAGHGSQILIADGNYPHATQRGLRARLVSLNLSPGVVSCNQVLTAVLSVVPVEAVHVMDYAREGPYALASNPPVWDEFRAALDDAGLDLPLDPMERFAFYEAAAGGDVALAIATADQGWYANILVTIGALAGS